MSTSKKEISPKRLSKKQSRKRSTKKGKEKLFTGKEAGKSNFYWDNESKVLISKISGLPAGSNLPQSRYRKNIPRTDEEEISKEMEKIQRFLVGEDNFEELGFEKPKTKITKKEQRILEEETKRFEEGDLDPKDPSKKKREIFVQRELKKLEKPEYTYIPSEDPVLKAIRDLMMKPKTFVEPPVERKQKIKKPKKPDEPETIVKKYGGMFTLNDKKNISKLLNYRGPNYEVEASFGTYKTGNRGGLTFVPGFKSFTYFNNIKTALEELRVQKGSGIQVQKENTRIETMNNISIRRIVNLDDDSISFQRKIRRPANILDYPTWGVRISLSEEQIVDLEAMNIELEKKEIEDFVPSVVRVKRRTTYINTRSDSKFYGVKFDLTHVEETHFNEGKPSTNTKYEVEIERTASKDKISADDFSNAVTYIYMFSQDKRETKNLVSLEERKFAVKLHNNLFWKDPSYSRWKANNPYILYGGYWNKPQNIKIRNLLDSRGNWEVTVKLNGVRRFMLIDDQATYLYGSNRNVFKIGTGIEEIAGTFIDGEYMQIGNKKTFYCFDLLFYKGEDIRQNNFKSRWEKLEKVFSVLTKMNFDINIELKEFYKEGNLYTRIRQAFIKTKEIEQQGEDLTDGIILQPPHWYKNNNTLKWKPPEKLTIDFLLTRIQESELEHVRQFSISENLSDEEILNYGYWTWVGGNKRLNTVFTGTKRNPFRGFIIYEPRLFEGQPISNRIIECSWDEEKGDFVPVRIREDRDKPNNYGTASSVWEDIRNPISKATIKGNTLKVVRKFHNKVKLNLLKQELRQGGKDITGKVFGDVILDIGSGRGGDLAKWNDVGIKKVYALEPSQENLAELERRKNELHKKNQVTTVVPLNLRAEETGEISRSIHERLDGIVSFFSLTFFPKDEEKYNSLLDTISLLPPGGKFIGIVMDGNKTKSLLEKEKAKVLEQINEEIERGETDESEKEEAEGRAAMFEGKAFNIEQTSKFKKTPYGNSIEISIHDPESMVKNQEEFLFYFDEFKKKLEARNFSYREKMFRIASEKGTSASDFIDRGGEFEILPKESKTFSSLMRVFVFTKQEVKIKPFDVQKPQEGKFKDLPNPYGIHLCVRGGPSSPSNLLHAVFYALDKKFRKSKNKEEMIKDIRTSKLVEFLKKEDFDQFSLGIGKKPTLDAYKEKLQDSGKWLADFSILELLMKYTKTNIYVLIGKTGKIGKAGHEKVVSIHPSSVFANKCEIYEYEKSIVLYTSDNIHYSLVFKPVNKKCDKDGQSVFYENKQKDEIFINEIYIQICSRFN